MISAYLVGDTELVARLNATPGGMQQSIARAVTRLSLEGQRLSQQKVSGQVLNVRSGALRSSINVRPTEVTATSVTGGWGTNISYARIHEMGGTIHHPGGTPYIVTSSGAIFVSLQDARSSMLPKTRPHDIHMPERSFLRSALRDMEPMIREGLYRAVDQEVQRIE